MENKLMVFEKVEVEVAEIDGMPMLELYSTGAALGQTVTAKGKAYPNKDRIDKNIENAEIKPVLRNAKLWISESQLYELMLEVKTDKVRPFRKWITTEVLPSINKTGSYSINREPYQYIPKTFRGEPVVTVLDITMKARIARQKVRYHVRHCKRGVDYYSLNGAELAEFKVENPAYTRIANNMFVITKKGFLKLAKMLSGLKQTEYFPKEPQKQISAPPTAFPGNHMYLDTPDNPKAQKIITTMNRQLTALSVMLEQYNRYLKPEDQQSSVKVVNDLCEAVFMSGRELERAPLQLVEKHW